MVRIRDLLTRPALKGAESQLTEPTGVEPCLGGTVRAFDEQDGASHRSSACQIEVGTTETTDIRRSARHRADRQEPKATMAGTNMSLILYFTAC
jgi:hypothetical protein